MAVLYLGATPVFADIEPSTLCLDPAKFEAAITDETRAVIPVHLYGSTPDMEAILEIAHRHNLIVIEDCAHAQGGKWNGRGLGSWGHVGSFSFQQSKTMACGEGGICLTNDDETAERLYRLKHIGYAPATAQGQAASGPPPGLICHNFRATEFQALILQDQLANLESLMATYNANAARLEDRLADVEGIRVQARGRLADPQSYYCWVVIFDEGPLTDVPLSRILEAIQAEGLTMGGTYGSVYQHMLWNIPESQYRIADGGCPVADGVGSQRAAVLPHQWLGADEETIGAIGEILVKVAANAEALRDSE
jgi:dTDP-4-amino-4,6-dideoxygalactose transaminase